MVRASIDRDLRADFGGLAHNDREELLGILELSGAAIAEVSSLTPTLLASTTSGFAVLHELSFPFWPAVIYVLVFAVVALYLLWLLSGLTFAQIGARNAALPAFGTGGEIRLRCKRTTIVSIAIYVANISLIILAVLVFSEKDEAGTFISTNLAAVDRAKERQATILQRWGDKIGIELRLDDLQEQITNYADEVARLSERAIPSNSAPASESSLDSPGWRRIQVSLCRLGFNPGPADGRPGRRTRRAIRQFRLMDGTNIGRDLTAEEIARLWSILPAISGTPNCT